MKIFIKIWKIIFLIPIKTKVLKFKITYNIFDNSIVNIMLLIIILIIILLVNIKKINI